MIAVLASMTDLPAPRVVALARELRASTAVALRSALPTAAWLECAGTQAVWVADFLTGVSVGYANAADAWLASALTYANE